jgi:hypothetical protein
MGRNIIVHSEKGGLIIIFCGGGGGLTLIFLYFVKKNLNFGGAQGAT